MNLASSPDPSCDALKRPSWPRTTSLDRGGVRARAGCWRFDSTGASPPTLPCAASG